MGRQGRGTGVASRLRATSTLLVAWNPLRVSRCTVLAFLVVAFSSTVCFDAFAVRLLHASSRWWRGVGRYGRCMSVMVTRFACISLNHHGCALQALLTAALTAATKQCSLKPMLAWKQYPQHLQLQRRPGLFTPHLVMMWWVCLAACALC